MRVLLTGGSGFIATHVLNELTKHGHEVVVTVRSPEKGKYLQQKFGASSEILFTILADITSEQACENAVQENGPFDAVIHTASPFHFNVTDAKKDILDPAVKGTINILNAIKRHAPTVKRVVITSSVAAMLDMSNPPDEIDQNSWSSVTMDQAMSNFGVTYPASKKFAELAAWDFVEKESPPFSLTAVNPPFVFGPILHDLQSLQNINTSNKRIVSAMDGSYKKSVPPTGSFMWVDVRDVALAHVRAMEQPEAAGRRFVLVSSYWTTKQMVEIIREEFPDLRSNLPDNVESDMPEKIWKFNNAPSKQILGLNYISLEKSVTDTVNSLLALQPMSHE